MNTVMGRMRDSVIWSIILLVAGIVILLWNFGVFQGFERGAQSVVAGVFGLAGLGFLGSYTVRRQEWWRVIPGFTLLAVGGIVYLSTRQVDPVWIGTLLFLGIALAFAVIYLSDRHQHWWALIPFGSLMVMIALVLLRNLNWANETLGALLFGGMGAVFALVYFLAHERRQFRWALIPMSVLLVMTLAALAAALTRAAPNLEQVFQLWPLLLVIAGIVLLGLTLRKSRPPQPQVTELPPEPVLAETPPAPGASVVTLPEAAAAEEYPAPEPVPAQPTESVPPGQEAQPEAAGGEEQRDRTDSLV